MKLVPHDNEVERAILGSLLAMPGFIGEISETLKPADFFNPGLGDIYEKMLTYFAEGKPIDLLVLELTPEGKREMEVALDMNLAPVLPTVKAYAEMIKDMARRRRLIQMAGEIAEIGYDDKVPAGEAETHCLQLMLDALEERETGTYYPLRSLVDEWGERIVAVLENPQELIGLDTGLKEMNRVLGGLEPKTLMVIAGRPSMGKSSLALTLAVNVARKGHTVGFASLEMSERHLIERMVATFAGVSSEGIRRGDLMPKEKERVYDALSQVKMLPIYFDCQPGVTSTELAIRARKLVATKRADLLIVDYLGLLQDRGEDEVKRLGKITTMLRATAKALNIPVIALHQLNRGVEKRMVKIPMLADLRGCLAGDTQILCGNGEVRSLSEMRPGNKLVVLGSGFSLGIGEIEKIWPTGRRPVFLLKTKSGRSIRATGEHRFLVYRPPHKGRGWGQSLTQRGTWPLEFIKVGDRIAVPRIYPSMDVRKTLTNDQAIIIGWLLGDAWIGRYGVELSVGNEEAAIFAQRLADWAWGLESVIVSRDDGTYIVRMTGRQGRIRQGDKRISNPLKQWLREQGIAGLGSGDKVIPQAVYRQDVGTIAAFLRGLLYADGSISKAKQSPRVRFSSTSRALAQGVQHLLVRLGVRATLCQEEMSSAGLESNYEHIYTARVDGYYETWNFASQGGGFLLEKERRFRDYIRPPDPMMSLSRRGKGMYFFDPVIAIEPAGVTETFDLTIAGKCSYFCANDILTHNSGRIEEDSDIVLFVHRDNYYQEEQMYKSESGPCTIIVAKNRHARTGKFKLFFDASGPCFRDYERAEGGRI